MAGSIEKFGSFTQELQNFLTNQGLSADGAKEIAPTKLPILGKCDGTETAQEVIAYFFSHFQESPLRQAVQKKFQAIDSQFDLSWVEPGGEGKFHQVDEAMRQKVENQVSKDPGFSKGLEWSFSYSEFGLLPPPEQKRLVEKYAPEEQKKALLEKLLVLNRDYKLSKVVARATRQHAEGLSRPEDRQKKLGLLQAALEIDPENGIIQFDLAQLYYESGDSTQAFPHVTQGLKNSGSGPAPEIWVELLQGAKDPAVSDPYDFVGGLLVDAARLEEAHKLFTQAEGQSTDVGRQEIYHRKALLAAEALHPYTQQFKEQKVREIYLALRAKGIPSAVIEGREPAGFIDDAKVLDYLAREWPNFEVQALCGDLGLDRKAVAQLYLQEMNRSFQADLNEFKLLAKTDRPAAEKKLTALMDRVSRYQFLLSERSPQQYGELESFRLGSKDLKNLQAWGGVLEFYQLVEDFYQTEHQDFSQSSWWKQREAMQKNPMDVLADLDWGKLEDEAIHLLRLQVDMGYRYQTTQTQMKAQEAKQARQRQAEKNLAQATYGRIWVKMELTQARSRAELRLKSEDCLTLKSREESYQEILKLDHLLDDTEHAAKVLGNWEGELRQMTGLQSDASTTLDAYGLLLKNVLELREHNTEFLLESRLNTQVMHLIDHMNDFPQDLQKQGLLPDKHYQAESDLRRALLRIVNDPHGDLWPLLSSEGMARYFSTHKDAGERSKLAFETLYQDDKMTARVYLLGSLDRYAQLRDNAMVESVIQDIKDYTTESGYLTGLELIEVDLAIYQSLKGTGLDQEDKIRDELMDAADRYLGEIRTYSHNSEETRGLLLLRHLYGEANDQAGLAAVEKKIRDRQKEQGDDLAIWLDAYNSIHDWEFPDLQSVEEKTEHLIQAGHLLETDLMFLGSSDLTKEGTRVVMNGRIWSDFDVALNMLNQVTELPEDARAAHVKKLGFTLSSLKRFTTGEFAFLTGDEYDRRVQALAPLAGELFDREMPLKEEPSDEEVRLHAKAKELFVEKFQLSLKAGDGAWFTRIESEYLAQFTEAAYAVAALEEKLPENVESGQALREQGLKIAVIYGQMGLPERMDQALAPVRNFLQASPDAQLRAERSMALVDLYIHSDRPDHITKANEVLQEIIALDPGPGAVDPKDRALHGQACMALVYHHLNEGKLEEAKDVLVSLGDFPGAKDFLQKLETGTEQMREQFTLQVARSVLFRRIHKMREKYHEDFETDEMVRGHKLLKDTNEFFAEWERQLGQGKRASEILEHLEAEGRFPEVFRYLKKSDRGAYLKRFIEDTRSPMLGDRKFSQAALKLAQDLVDDKDYQSGMEICEFLRHDPYVGERAQSMVKNEISDVARSDALLSALWTELKNATVIFAESKEEAVKSLILLIAGFGIGKIASMGAKAGYSMWVVRGLKGAAFLEKHQVLGMGLVGVTAEAAAFTTTNMLGSAALNNDFSHMTWGNWGREFGAMMVTFGLLHGYGASLERIGPRFITSESALARRGFGMAAYTGQIFTFTTSGYINEGIGLQEASNAPFALRFFQSVLMDAQMRLAHKAVSPLTRRWEKNLEASTAAMKVLQQLKVTGGTFRYSSMHEALVHYSRPHLENPQARVKAWEDVLHYTDRWSEFSGLKEGNARLDLLENLLRSEWNADTLKKIDQDLLSGKVRWVKEGSQFRLEEIPTETSAVSQGESADALAAHRETLATFGLERDLTLEEKNNFTQSIVTALKKSTRDPQEVREAFSTMNWALEAAGMDAPLLKRVVFLKMLRGDISLQEAQGIARGVWNGELKVELKTEGAQLAWDVTVVSGSEAVASWRQQVHQRMGSTLPEKLWDKYSPDEQKALRKVFNALGYRGKAAGADWSPKTPEALILLKALHVEASTSGTAGSLDMLQLKRLEGSAADWARASEALAEAGGLNHPRNKAQILAWAWARGESPRSLRNMAAKVHEGRLEIREGQDGIEIHDKKIPAAPKPSQSADTKPWAARSALGVEVLPPEISPLAGPDQVLGTSATNSLVRSLKKQAGADTAVELVSARGVDAITLAKHIETSVPVGSRKDGTIVVAHLEGEGGRHFLVADTYANLTSVAKLNFLLHGDYRPESFYLDYQIQGPDQGRSPTVRVGYLQISSQMARPTLLARMLKGLTASMESRFPGVTVETRASNLVSGELLMRGLGSGRFVFITDPKEHPIQTTFDPQLIEHLAKAKLIDSEAAANLTKRVEVLEGEVARHRAQLQGMVDQGLLTEPVAQAKAFQEVNPQKLVRLHNEFVLAVRKQYGEARKAGTTKAGSEVEFFYEGLRSSPGGKTLLRNPYRGDLWVEGNLKGERKTPWTYRPLKPEAQKSKSADDFSFGDLNEALGLEPPAPAKDAPKPKPDYKVENEFLAESQAVTDQYFVTTKDQPDAYQVKSDPNVPPPQMRHMAPKMEILEKWSRPLNFYTGEGDQTRTRHMGKMGLLASEALGFLHTAKNLETQLWNVEYEIYLLKTPLEEMNEANREVAKSNGFDKLSSDQRIDKIIERERKQESLEHQIHFGLGKVFLFETAYEQVSKRLDDVYHVEWSMVEAMRPRTPKETPLVLDVESDLRMEMSLEELVLPNGNRAPIDDPRGIPSIAYVGEQVLTGLGDNGKGHNYDVDMGVVTVTARSAKDIPQVARLMLKRFGANHFERILESDGAWSYIYESRTGTRTMIHIVEPVYEITPDMVVTKSAMPPPIPSTARKAEPLAAQTNLVGDTAKPEGSKPPRGGGAVLALLAGLGTLLTPGIAEAAVDTASRANESLLNGGGILAMTTLGVAGVFSWLLGRRAFSKPMAPQTQILQETHPTMEPPAAQWHPTQPGPVALGEPLRRDNTGRILPPDLSGAPDQASTFKQWQEAPAVHFGGAAARTHKGVEYSKTNEDRFEVMELPGGRRILFAIDGIGGHGGGDRAAESFRRTVDWALKHGAEFSEAIQVGQDAVREENLRLGFGDGKGRVKASAPGAVMVGVEITPQADGNFRGRFLSVSDSEALVLRKNPDTGEWLPVFTTQRPTKMLQESMKQSGNIPFALHPDGRIKMGEALKLHTAPGANMVEATIGAEFFRVDSKDFTLQRGDLVLTMSDGAGENFSYFEMAHLAESVERQGRVDPQAMTDAMMNEGLVRMALLAVGKEMGTPMILDHETYWRAYQKAGLPLPEGTGPLGMYESRWNSQGYFEQYVLDAKGNVHLHLRDGEGKLINRPEETMLAHFKRDNITVVTHEVGQEIRDPRAREVYMADPVPLAAQQTLIEAAPVPMGEHLIPGTHFFGDGIIPLNDPGLKQLGQIEVYVGHPDQAPQPSKQRGAVLVVGDAAHNYGIHLQGVLVWDGSQWMFSPQAPVAVGDGHRIPTQGAFALENEGGVGLGLSHFHLDAQGRWVSDLTGGEFGAVYIQMRMP